MNEVTHTWPAVDPLVVQATAVASPPVSPVELSVLIDYHRPPVKRPCRVCGSLDMQISSMGTGEPTELHCGVAVAQLYGPARDQSREAQGVAAAHRWQSRQTLTFGGDERVLQVLLELRALRVAAGDDMTVPVGTLVYPNGHGKHRCWRFLRHIGGDVWVSVTDHDFEHDPGHGAVVDA